MSIEQAKDLAFLLRKDNGIVTPYTPVKRLMRIFTTIYYFYNYQNPDFANEAGFTVYDPGDATYRTYINADLPEGRDNFTYAHEFGHIVNGHLRNYDCNNLTEAQYRQLDREANIFAANILMPEEWVRVFASPPLTAAKIAKLKHLFGVSWAAMIHRLDELGIQDRQITYQLFQKNIPNKSAKLSGFTVS